MKGGVSLAVLVFIFYLMDFSGSTDIINIGNPNTGAPSKLPTIAPASKMPSLGPTLRPSFAVMPPKVAPPTSDPTGQPTSFPSITPLPTPLPSSQPSRQPTGQPSSQPTSQPSRQPSRQPTGQPTMQPSGPSSFPTSGPSRQPSSQPSSAPSRTGKPTVLRRPSSQPTGQPTRQPTSQPTRQPTNQPTSQPSIPTGQPTRQPSSQPSRQPYASPTSDPTSAPSNPTCRPTSQPSGQPVAWPTFYPSSQPSSQPSTQPTTQPTMRPSRSTKPTRFPTSQPSTGPTSQPSVRPTGSPTITFHPSKTPTGQPTGEPTMYISKRPTGQPTGQPSTYPTSPTGQPSSQPSSSPVTRPSRRPTGQPTSKPSRRPSSQPSAQPSVPTSQPSSRPSTQPSSQPSSMPTVTFKPSYLPTGQPSSGPTGQPSMRPTANPTRSMKPTFRPTSRPTSRPSSQPTFYEFFGLTERPTAAFELFEITGVVQFTPDNNDTCNPVEISLSFALNKVLPVTASIFIRASGITSGPCHLPNDGRNITSLLLDDNFQFEASYTEGSFLTGYQDSYIVLTVLSQPLAAQTEYKFSIDRASGLRRSCSSATTWSVDARPAPLGISRGLIGFLDTSENFPKKCRLYSSSITFSDAHPQFPIGINISMQLGFLITAGTTIKITLPKFTNNRNGYVLNSFGIYNDGILPGSDAVLRSISSSTKFSWTGMWFEGAFNDYSGSYLQVTSLGNQATLDSVWIYIDSAANNIVPLCGRKRNDPDIKITVASSSYYVKRESVRSTNPIGRGCDQFKGCLNSGTCDYCLGKCSCYDGFGSDDDKRFTLADNFPPDCSGRSCPIGPAIATNILNSQTGGNETTINRKSNMHRLIECSNNGLCDRGTGKCQCFSGFTGPACQSMVCPGKPACSNRGRCLSMARLALASDALPLTYSSYRYLPLQTGTPATWDYQLGHMCVCDSSWPVGLKAGQTQQAEYFGPACEFRRCPSGDDPSTSIDERNCEGLALTGGIDVGEMGNLCHVDCSNRGSCDYNTGLCHCYPGYGGHNCGTKVPGA